MPLINETTQEYLLAAVCPACSHQPTARYSRTAVDRAAAFPPDEVYRDEKCVRCGLVYMLAWVAVAHAFPVEPKAQKLKPWAA